jgi:hypothetical protein
MVKKTGDLLRLPQRRHSHLLTFEVRCNKEKSPCSLRG